MLLMIPQWIDLGIDFFISSWYVGSYITSIPYLYILLYFFYKIIYDICFCFCKYDGDDDNNFFEMFVNFFKLFEAFSYIWAIIGLFVFFVPKIETEYRTKYSSFYYYDYNYDYDYNNTFIEDDIINIGRAWSIGHVVFYTPYIFYILYIFYMR